MELMHYYAESCILHSISFVIAFDDSIYGEYYLHMMKECVDWACIHWMREGLIEI